MNLDHSTSVIPDQSVGELVVSAERTLQAKPAWHRPSLTHIDIKRTMSSSGVGLDCSSQTGPTCSS
jgi:hypothetical protein